MSLKIVVLAKQVPDTRNVGKDAMTAEGTVNRAALPAIFNPEDLNALEQALRLKEQNPGSTVGILTMGPPRAGEIIRQGLYRGADTGWLLTDRLFAGADTLATSYALATGIQKIGDVDIVIGGRQAIDGDTTTSEHTEIPKDAIVVYYKDGREVPAYNLTMDASVVSFKTSKRAKDRPIFSPKSEVFMIRYPDGTRDILTNLAVAEQQQREREAEEARLKAQREAEVADSIKAAAIEEAASATNPKKATIVTKKGVRMKVWVCSDTATMVSYKKVNSAKAPVFNMSKAKIKNIIY